MIEAASTSRHASQSLHATRSRATGPIALATQKEIDRLPPAVNGTVKICPPTLHFDVGLVHSPRSICHLKMGPHSLIDLRRVALRPARHGSVIDGNAAIGQHPFKVSIADWELKVPTHRPKDDVSRKMTASKLFLLLLIVAAPLYGAYLSRPSSHRQSLQQNPWVYTVAAPDVETEIPE